MNEVLGDFNENWFKTIESSNRTLSIVFIYLQVNVLLFYKLFSIMYSNNMLSDQYIIDYI